MLRGCIQPFDDQPPSPRTPDFAASYNRGSLDGYVCPPGDPSNQPRALTSPLLGVRWRSSSGSVSGEAIRPYVRAGLDCSAKWEDGSWCGTVIVTVVMGPLHRACGC